MVTKKHLYETILFKHVWALKKEEHDIQIIWDAGKNKVKDLVVMQQVLMRKLDSSATIINKKSEQILIMTSQKKAPTLARKMH